MDRVPTFLVTAVTLVMAVATVLLGITVPQLWSMSGDIGAIKARHDGTDRRFDSIDRRLEGVDGKLDGVGKRIDALDNRIAQRETDPAALVAQAGLRPSSEFSGARIGTKFYVLPRSDNAQAELARAGLAREAITPSFFGYVIGEFDQATGAVKMVGSAPARDVAPVDQARPNR